MSRAASRELMHKKILHHGLQLKTIYKDCSADPVALCKFLRRLENRAHHLTEILCSVGDDDDAHNELDVILYQVGRLLGESGPRPFINYDPRGYSLKINVDGLPVGAIYTDWGGYGILAPDFRCN